jgi:hypothetical protein
MFQHFLIKNYRCFSSLQLSPLARVNLIAGMNNTGKTALLEALHLHSYPQNAELPFTINEWRESVPERRFDEAVVSWLFFDRQPALRIEFISIDEQNDSRSLQIAFGDGAELRRQFLDVDQFVAGSLLEGEWKTNQPRVALKTTAQGKESYAVGIISQRTGLFSIQSSVPWNGPSVFLSSWRHFPDEEVKAFSALEAANRQQEILPSLQLLEPRLTRLSLILVADRPVIHADIGLNQLVPITLMGEGIRRLLAILAAVVNAKGGRVLIDEIENGLHYSVQKDVWKAIADAARRCDVQVFATTHSYECIAAAHEAFAARGPYDLRLFRLDRIDGGIQVAAYDREILEYAAEMSHEVR